MTKDELLSLRYAQEHINSRRKEIEILREQIEYIRGIDYSKDKTGNSQVTQEDLICNLIEQECNLMQDIKALEERKAIAKQYIFQLDKEKLQLVMYKRYILCESWSKIAEDIGNEERHIKRLNGEALQKIREMSLNVTP